jgi:hypothetical protein
MRGPGEPRRVVPVDDALGARPDRPARRARCRFAAAAENVDLIFAC